MAEAFLQLNSEDRQEALGVAAGKSGRPMHLLEKDVWVVWALATMFESPFGPRLVFKGGTSLSKAYGAIRRFSEDIDLTYDIRAIADDLVGKDNAEALPLTSSQEKKWTKAIRERLGQWVSKSVVPLIQQEIERQGLSAKVSLDGKDGDVVHIDYDHVAEGSGYVPPKVTLEFGARSTGEPCESKPVTCDMAKELPELVFPTSTPRVMKAERTFWEKATAIHVLCMGGKLRGGPRFSRHWYDVVQLDRSGHAASAIAMPDIAKQVATHKAMFFAEKVESGRVIDYSAAVSGGLRLVPEGTRLDELKQDYQRMVDDGLLLDAEKPFDEILGGCRQIQERANVAMAGRK
jgi:hypothetical protein